MDANTPPRLRPAGARSIGRKIRAALRDRLFEHSFYIGALALIGLMEWYARLMHTPRMPWVYVALAAIAAAFAILRLRPARARIPLLKKARRSRRIVAGHLAELQKSGAQIFQDVQGDGFNLDQVLLCPQGIFAIEARTLAGPYLKAGIDFDGERVLVGGREPQSNPIAHLHAQMRGLEDLLKRATGKDVVVRGALVFPNSRIRSTARARRKGLWVVDPRALARRIERERPRLQPEEADVIAHHLRRCSHAEA